MAVITTKLEENLVTLGGAENRQAVRTEYNEPRGNMNPGELLAASLGACMMTMVGFLAARRKESVAGTQVHVEPSFDEKHSRITAFTVTFVFPDTLTQTQKDFYANAAQSCPVHNSLKEDISYKVIVK
jgi:uncharacterized OsmC-like protein